MIAPPALSRSAAIWTYRLLWLAAILLIAAMPLIIVIRGEVWLGPAAFTPESPQLRPLIVIAGDVSVSGASVAPLIVLGGDATVDGVLSDDLVVIGGNIYLDRHAVINSSLVALIGQTYRAPDAQIQGAIGSAAHEWTNYPLTNRAIEQVDLIRQVRLGLAAGLGLLLLCLVIAAMLPWSIIITAATARYAPIRSALAAVTGLLAVPLLLLPLTLSLIGMPLAVLLSLGAVVVWLVGLTAAGFLIGRWLIGETAGQYGYLRVVVVGLAPILLSLAIPVLGPLFVGAVGFLGAGARMVSFVEKSRALVAMDAIAIGWA